VKIRYAGPEVLQAYDFRVQNSNPACPRAMTVGHETAAVLRPDYQDRFA